MPRTCTREEIRELDRRAIEEYGMPGVALMENAGAGAARIAAEMLGDPFSMNVAILCGKGNNGGDGYVIARHLANQGANVNLLLACDPSEISPECDAGVNLRIARNMAIFMQPARDDGEFDMALAFVKEAHLIVDALLGTGLSGDVREPYLSLIRMINAADAPVLSVDIPSGLDANLGKVLRAAVRANRTATFVLPKRGFYLLEGPAHTGQVDVVDIGMPRDLVESLDGISDEELRGLGDEPTG